MFERLSERARLLADARARRRRERLAERISGTGLRGVTVSAEEEAVVLSGRGLRRRSASDPELRWIVAESRDG
jgi:FAD/FMN-containing dehydrogenase